MNVTCGASTLFRKYDSELCDKSVGFQAKIESNINLWKEIGSMDLSKWNIKEVVKLLNWASAHTLDVVLSVDWALSEKVYQSDFLNSVESVQCKLEINGAALRPPIEKLVGIIKNPWANDRLSDLLEDNSPSVSNKIRFFCSETVYLIAIRLKKLCDSNNDELAYNLISAFIEFKKNAEMNFFAVDGSSNQMWFVFDIYAALLYKLRKNRELIALIKQLNFEAGFELIQRLISKNGLVCRIWIDSWKIAVVAVQTYLTEILFFYSEQMKDTLKKYVQLYLSICNRFGVVNEFSTNIDKITNLCDLYSLNTVRSIVQKNCGSYDLRDLTVKLYIKAIAAHRNNLERHKQNGDHRNIRRTNTMLADLFSSLADLFKDNPKVARECTLTSFSLKPSVTVMQRLRGYAAKMLDENFELNKNELIHSQYADLSLERAMKYQELGISEDVCDDLTSCIAGSRYKCLSWNIPWKDLYPMCREYLKNPHSAAKFIANLEFLNIDYDELKWSPPALPKVYDLVEKGYEKYLEKSLFSNLDFPKDISDFDVRPPSAEDQALLRNKKMLILRIERLREDELSTLMRNMLHKM